MGHGSAVVPLASPGRHCPLSYRYAPSVFQHGPVLEAETLYVIGGLYGNTEALRTVLEMKRAEERRGRRVTLLFNGDFNWFNIDPDGFRQVNETVLAHRAILGNVEAELCEPGSGAGCGCAYPADVPDALVARSNRIMDALQRVARVCPDAVEWLSGLPLHATVMVGEKRIGIVHGDAESLAGWQFAADRLRQIHRGVYRDRLAAWFRQARVDAFCSSHTCLPAMQTFRVDRRAVLIANNGAAGMPNFQATGFGLLTRVSVHADPPRAALYGVAWGSGRADALPIPYDRDAWLRRFARNWGPDSPAHLSYFERLTQGPAHTLAQAVLDGVRYGR